MDYAMASTSLAHTYGNITSFATEFIKGLFPKNYFRTVHISSTIAYRQFNIFQNTNKEFIKKTKPMLVIRPRLELMSQDTFLNGTFLTQRISDAYSDLDFSNLQPFMEDKDKAIQMKYLLNRIQMFFDVVIITDSQMDQINQANYLKNRIRQDHPFFISTYLESHIPREMMKLLSDDIQIPVMDDNGSVKPFLDYVNSHSIYPISYKMKNSTGNDEFFRFYPVNVDTTITNLQLDDGNKKNFVGDTYTVSFTMSTEFNAAGLYYYLTNNPQVITEVDLSILTDSDSIIPIFTFNNTYSQIMPEGWNLYASPMYKVESNKTPDEMDISSLFNNSLMAAIKYHVDNGIPLETFLNATVLKDNTVLDASIGEYKIDFANLKLTTYNTNTVSTYRLMIYVNTLYINNLISNLYLLNKER